MGPVERFFRTKFRAPLRRSREPRFWTAAADVRTTDSVEGAALLQIGAGRVFKLNRSGAAIWAKLATRESPSEIARRLASDCGAPIPEIESHVEQFARSLAGLGLLVNAEEVRS